MINFMTNLRKLNNQERGSDTQIDVYKRASKSNGKSKSSSFKVDVHKESSENSNSKSSIMQNDGEEGSKLPTTVNAENPAFS